MIILFILFCCVILLILKCVVLVTFWFLRKFKNIQISCQSSNLVWYKNIVFSSNSNLEFSVNNIWLSSSYVNSSFNKPLVIGLSGCKVKVRSKFRRLPGEERGDSNKTSSKHLQTILRIMKKLTSLCICDLNAEHSDKKAVTFIESSRVELHLEREVFENVPTICLLSQGFSVSHIPHLKSKVVEFSSNSVVKVSVTLHLSPGASSTPVSIQSLKIDCSQLRVSLDGDVLGLPPSFGGKNKHLNIVDEDSDIYGDDDDDDGDDDTISEGDDDVLENRVGHFSDDDEESEIAKKKEEHSTRKLSTMLKFIPVLIQVNMKDMKTVLQWESQERNLSTSWKDLSVTSEIRPQGSGDSHHGEVKIDMSDLKMGMSHHDMLSVEQIGCQLMLSKEEVSVTLNCKGGLVTYLHDEVMFCSHLVRHLVNMRPSERQQPSTKPQQQHSSTNENILKRFFTSGVLQIKFYANIYSFALAVSHGIDTPRFVLGLPGARVSALGSVQDELLSDYILEVEMTSTYVRLLQQDKNNNNNLNNKMEELCARKHFWDTPMYLGLLFLKVTKYGDHISVECMVDNLRFETSGPILATVQSLDDILRHDLVEFYHWLKASRMKSAVKTDRPPRQAGKSVQLFLQMSCFNVFLCHENNASVMLRCDSASVPLSSPTDVNLIIFGVKATHFFRTGKFHAITKSSDISNEILSIPMASINFNIPLKNVVVEAAENVLVVWSYSAHLCLHEVSRRLLGILKQGSSRSMVDKEDDDDDDDGRVKEGRTERVEVMLFFSCSIRVNLPSNHFMKVDVKNLQLEQTSTDGIIIKTSRLLVSSDQHPFLTFENLKVKSDLRGEKLSSERSLSSHDLQLPLNRAWIITAEELSFVFAFDYNFASWFEEVKSLRKWLKLKHSKATKVPAVAADVCLLIDCIKIQICDDPFEVRLGDNYELLCDESLENEKRMTALSKRIEELKMKSSFIPEEKLDSLYISLSEKMSQVYIQRANQMYSQSPMRNSLCMWVIQSFELILLADPSMTSKSDIMSFMQEVNSESPLPKDLELQTCFLRKIRCSTSSIIFQLRDFPHPMLQIEDWLISGKFCGSEASGTNRGQKTRTIHLGHPWGTSTITKNIPPVKLYYDINSELKSFSMTYGSCWEPIVSQISLSMNKIFPPPCDPSPALPFWDKWRYLLHGNFVVLMERGSWMCHASLDPYNTTEFMDWTWSDLVFKWVTGEVTFEGDLEILLRTASKYDECCFLKWNSLQLLFKLDWQCMGDPNDHHSVKPCSPEYVAIMLQNKDHDTYVKFRSTSLTFGCSMRSAVHPLPSSPLNFSSMSPGDLFSPGPSSSPKCLFYSSTIRWLDHLKVCLARISRPIRRGRYFNTPVTGKPKFSRHISCLNFTLVLPSLNCSYWSSFRRSFGVELNSGPIRLDASAALETRQPIEGTQEAGLRRRPQRVVHAMKLQAHFESLAVWLSSQIHQRKTKFKPLESERSFLLSVDKVNYQRIEEQQETDKQASDEPLHQVEVHNLKACWTPYNRDIVFALHDSYTKSQMLQRNLSADAFKGIKVEASCQTPKKPAKPVGHHFSFSPSNQPPHADALLQKLISESQSKFVAVHEEISGAGVDMEHLQGYQVCQTDDVLRKNWIVTLVNSQVMLSGCETSGCIIVSTPKASLLSCLHHPVITSNHQLRSKTTLVGSVESMQYYATITDDIRPENIRWLTTRDIEERQSMTNQGSMNSLTLENIINDMDDVETDVSHIQRIISRCQCQFYWSWYGELEDDILEVPLQKIEEYSDVMKTQEGIDAFTLIHHDLNICTNSVQYATALDIVNNLLLHVEPKKKEQLEKLMDMRFKLQLSSDADQKTPIFVKQNHLRRLTEKMRVLEKEVYLSQRTSFDGETQELVKDLEDTKEQINFLSEELALMLSCYRESLLQTSSSSSSSSSSQKQSTMKREAMMTKKIDFYLQHVEWRLNESDGQIGISHIVLSNFLYTKTMHENDCGSHQLELGWCHVTNLLPEDQAYRDVLVPQDPLGRASLGNRRAILRVLCKFRSPVGGISIKEHLEVNVIPLTIQMTARFYSVVMLFFFPGKPVDSDEESVSDVEESQSTSSLTLAPSKRKFASLRKKSSTMSSVNDIDKMKERAAKNNMFIYIKISDVSLKVSYKSEKDKHIMNIKDFQFLSPMLEYHNQTWSWHDLTITLKKECKKVIIAQAVRQKLHIKSRSLFSDMMTFPRGVTGSEEDKTKLLLGLSIPETKQKKSKKRGLFGKLNHDR